ncbi:MAG: hypothetical protein HYV75_08300, partial [Opitutae bacterium]|nr:hypothetical protein [Opitutae bacterium]
MTFRPLPYACALVAMLAAPVLAHAQAEISAAEEQRLEALARENAELYLPKSKVSVGFRVLSSGARVNFGNLGMVAFNLHPAPAADGSVDRVYDNGAVRTDTPRLEERDENNVQTSTPGGRYAVFTTVTVDVKDADGNVIGTEQVLRQVGDYRAYTPGLTRNWGYGAASQVTADGHIAMSTYSSTSEGAGAMKKEGMSPGIEFQYVRTFSRSTRRLQWGLLAGLTLNGINSKTAGSVTSTLNVRTDYYSLAGAAAPALPYVGPTFEDYVNSAGEVIQTNGLETTTPITALPDGHQETSITGGATVNGRWQVKGSYFMVRIGPSLHAQLTERLGLSASLGLAGAYAGTTYSVSETFQVPDLPDVLVGANAGPRRDGIEQVTEARFLTGYYADLNM